MSPRHAQLSGTNIGQLVVGKSHLGPANGFRCLVRRNPAEMLGVMPLAREQIQPHRHRPPARHGDFPEELVAVLALMKSPLPQNNHQPFVTRPVQTHR